MSIRFNFTPNYDQPLQTKGVITRTWYSFWQGLQDGTPTADASVVTLGTSPATYAPTGAGTLYLSGGSTTQVEISRDGRNFYPTGQVAGAFPLRKADLLRITYPVAPPTSTWMPL